MQPGKYEILAAIARDVMLFMDDVITGTIL